MVRLPFPIKRRLEFGRRLGIPFNQLRSIEQWALDKTNTKEIVLTEMMHFWFINNPSASFKTVKDVLAEMEMTEHLEDDYKKREVELLTMGSTVTKENIPFIINIVIGQLCASELEIALKKVYKDKSDGQEGQVSIMDDGRDEETKLRCVLEAWVDTRKDDATWNSLVYAMRGVSDSAQQVAMRITEMRRHPPSGIMQ